MRSSAPERCRWPAGRTCSDRPRPPRAGRRPRPGRAGPADAVLAGELADLAGELLLVAARRVSPGPVEGTVGRHQAGMMLAEPAVEPFPGPRPQVQHDRGDV